MNLNNEKVPVCVKDVILSYVNKEIIEDVKIYAVYADFPYCVDMVGDEEYRYREHEDYKELIPSINKAIWANKMKYQEKDYYFFLFLTKDSEFPYCWINNHTKEKDIEIYMGNLHNVKERFKENYKDIEYLFNDSDKL